MTEADRKATLRGMDKEDIADLAEGRVSGRVWRAAWTRANGLTDEAAARLTEMIEAAKETKR